MDQRRYQDILEKRLVRLKRLRRENEHDGTAACLQLLDVSIAATEADIRGALQRESIDQSWKNRTDRR